MIILFKICYSVIALIKILVNSSKFPDILSLLKGKGAQISLKNGLIFNILQPLDIIIIKETILDDSYNLSQFNEPFHFAIDVGAGLGDFCITLAKKFPKAKILAFEPNPEQFLLLKRNISINKVNNIEAYEYAVGTKTNYELFIPASNVKASTLKRPDIKTMQKTIKVTGRKLSEYLFNNLDFLKIDVEGGEMDVLESLGIENIPKIKKFVIEYHNCIVPDTDKEITRFFKNSSLVLTKTKDKVSDTGYIIGAPK